MKILITGAAGTGKTTALAELQKRGYLVIDLDATGLCRWRNKITGEYAEYGKERKDTSWFDQHRWYCDNETLTKFLSHIRPDKEVFVGGVVKNIVEVGEKFDKKFLLTADGAVLCDRLTNRTNNVFGKHTHEQEATIKYDALLREALPDYVLIDSTKTTEEVVDIILSNLKG